MPTNHLTISNVLAPVPDHALRSPLEAAVLPANVVPFESQQNRRAAA